MHISKLTLVNYRNFLNASFLFHKGINTIIGENGSGKTNIFRAIRLLLDDNMVRAAYRMDQGDFCRGLSDWRGHWIIISLEFSEISPDEAVQALFVHGTADVGEDPPKRATLNLIFRPKKDVRLRLAALRDGDRAGLNAIRDTIKIDSYETVMTGRSTADFSTPGVYSQIVGDFGRVIFNDEVEFASIGAPVSKLMSISKEVSFTFVQALRNVLDEFHSNRTNPLFALLKNKSGTIDPTEFGAITEQVKNLNQSIEGLNDVKKVRADIFETINDTAGEAYSPSSLSIKSDLSDKADELFQSLKLFVGESGGDYEGPIHELSLGGANLIFLTLKLLEFKYRKQRQAIANFLLIEEPEAHIHNHIQKTLFDKLDYADTQIIYSTHSTQISEVSNVEKVNILGRSSGYCESFQPTTALAPEMIGNIQRYLDAVRSNLLFAKSVILVEGDAEEILIPIMIKKVLGISLDELGISLVNIRSTGFKNVASLFHDSRIRKKCAIVTDLDAAIIDPIPVPGEPITTTEFRAKSARSAASGLQRKVDLEQFIDRNQWLGLFLADHTLEVDFVKAGNTLLAVSSIADVYTDPATIGLATGELRSGNLMLMGWRMLTMAKYLGKGWFAILLGKHLTSFTVIPPYILNAVFFAHPAPSREVWFNILKHRLAILEPFFPTTIAPFKEILPRFRKGEVGIPEMIAVITALHPGDPSLPILQRFR